MTNAEGAKLEGIESGANKFQYPVNPGEGQVLTWSAGAAKWDNPASGYEYIELGDIFTDKPCKDFYRTGLERLY